MSWDAYTGVSTGQFCKAIRAHPDQSSVCKGAELLTEDNKGCSDGKMQIVQRGSEMSLCEGAALFLAAVFYLSQLCVLPQEL